MTTPMRRDGGSRGEQLSLQRAVAGAKHDQLRRGVNQRIGVCDQQVHALLPGQPADDAQDRPGLSSSPKRSSTAFRFAARFSSVSAVVVGSQMLVGRGIPDIIVDAVDDAVEVR
jgi:hypothetical protein